MPYKYYKYKGIKIDKLLILEKSPKYNRWYAFNKSMCMMWNIIRILKTIVKSKKQKTTKSNKNLKKSNVDEWYHGYNIIDFQ